MQFFVSNYVGPELTDILSSLTCIVVMVARAEALEAEDHHAARGRQAGHAAMTRRTPPASCSRRGCPTCCSSCSCWPGASRRSRRRIDRWTHGILLPAFLPKSATVLQRPERARPAQPDHAHAAGDGRAGALRRRVHVQLAERVGHGLLPRHMIAAALLLRRRARAVRRASTRRRSSSWRSRC